MLKDELHKLLKEHPVGNIQEQFFKKKFPEFYEDIMKISFPEDFRFSQKLYHYFNDDYDFLNGVCPICGKRTSFLSFVSGYQKYCSSKCAHQDEELLKRTQQTRLQVYGVGCESIVQKSKYSKMCRYGDENYNNITQAKQTNIKRYGVKYYTQTQEYKDIIENKLKNRTLEEKENIINKIKNTKKERYGSENYNNISKCKETCLSKYNVDNYTKTDTYKNILKECNSERVKKIFETKKQHNTLNSSKIEELFEQFLLENNIDFKRQYMDDRYCDENTGYNFHCDFYLPKYDLFIEIQGNWTHGGHPFDSSNQNDVEIVEKWKSKKSPYYDKAIEDWTNRDVKKRTIAYKNGLNYLEFFTKDINVIITGLNNYVKEI